MKRFGRETDKAFPNGKCRKVKKNDVSAVGNQIRNVGGGGWTSKYRERRYLLGKAVVSSSVHIMKGGVGGRVNDDPLQVPAWFRSRDQLGPATGKSDGATTPGVQSQLPQGHN